MRVSFCILISFLISSCASSPHRTTKSSKAVINELSETLSLKNQAVSLLEEENMILKALLNKKKFSPNLYKKSEVYLYKQVLKSYKEKDLPGFLKFSGILLSLYPGSDYEKNIAYLKPIIHYKSGSYVEALSGFDTYAEKYPGSHQVLSLKMFKAFTYKKLNMKDKAKSILDFVVKNYPGTKQARLARREIKRLTTAL